MVNGIRGKYLVRGLFSSKIIMKVFKNLFGNNSKLHANNIVFGSKYRTVTLSDLLRIDFSNSVATNDEKFVELTERGVYLLTIAIPQRPNIYVVSIWTVGETPIIHELIRNTTTIDIQPVPGGVRFKSTQNYHHYYVNRL